ncbi:hypothetical protein DY000_02045900 [Brassica cretica]|uniref:Sugar phosphate transporter domain-containing protein n=1 Tax=Brassica cretica TaxID=69181 RepID=A0ABQ7F6N7_BRACR|nr:hypothetical protein DY000_02045900 [Brassica cretica]
MVLSSLSTGVVIASGGEPGFHWFGFIRAASTQVALLSLAIVSLGGSRPLSRWLTGLKKHVGGEIFRSVGQTFDLESPIGNKIGQAGVDFGSGLNVMVQQFFRRLPIPFLNDDSKLIGKSLRSHRAYVDTKDDLGLAAERLIDSDFSKTDDSVTLSEEEVADSYLRTGGFLGRSKIDISSSYDSRINGMEHSLAARGDIWRLEASSSSSTASDGTSSETRLSSRRRKISRFSDTCRRLDRICFDCSIITSRILIPRPRWFGIPLNEGLGGLGFVIGSLLMEKLNSMNLMLYMSPIAVVALLPVTLVMEPDVISLTLTLAKQHQYMWILLLVNSVMAYSANLLNFLVTKHTSALTLQVLGNAKGAVAVVISILIFQNPVTVMGIGGYSITVLGLVAYGETKRRFR